MSEKDLLLAIDNGTQSLKALVFDAEGTLLARERVAFEPYFSKRPGWAEQDPDVFWTALCQACSSLWRNENVNKDAVAAVSITTQRSTVVNLDKDGRPLRPAILWLDQRKSTSLPAMKGSWGALFKILRLSPLINWYRAEAESNWIRTNQPELWDKTHKYLLLSGYQTFKLTGEYADSTACQPGYIPFDFKKQRWCPSWDWKWKALGIEPEQLPELYQPGERIGTISRQAALETGIPEGLPLIAAASDKACEVIGSGSIDPTVGCLSYGTTATINVTHKKYMEPISKMPPYPSAVPGLYSMEVMIYRGFWMVSWFKEEFGHLEKQEADIQGIDVEALFDKLVEDVPAGSMGLMLQPYWTPGARTPGPEAKGSIIGFGDVHTRAHMYKSILEGLAYALRDGKEQIERKSGVPIRSLRVSGGGSQSRIAMQGTADIFGLPTARPSIYETSALGAAIDAAVGIGLHGDFETAVKRMTHIGDVFEPDMETHALYDALYRQVYRKMYKRLKPLYSRIKAITGYPG